MYYGTRLKEKLANYGRNLAFIIYVSPPPPTYILIRAWISLAISGCDIFCFRNTPLQIITGCGVTVNQVVIEIHVLPSEIFRLMARGAFSY